MSYRHAFGLPLAILIAALTTKMAVHDIAECLPQIDVVMNLFGIAWTVTNTSFSCRTAGRASRS